MPRRKTGRTPSGMHAKLAIALISIAVVSTGFWALATQNWPTTGYAVSMITSGPSMRTTNEAVQINMSTNGNYPAGFWYATYDYYSSHGNKYSSSTGYTCKGKFNSQTRYYDYSCPITGLNPVTIYIFTIGWNKTVDFPVYTLENSNWKFLTAPDPVQNFRAIAGDGWISLTWDPVWGIDCYKVLRNDTLIKGSGDVTCVQQQNPIEQWPEDLMFDLFTNSYNDTNATNGITYSYRVVPLAVRADYNLFSYIFSDNITATPRRSNACNDTYLDYNETCEPGPPLQLGGKNCTNIGQGFTGGMLGCTQLCTLNTSTCTSPPPAQNQTSQCGNGIIEGTEQCDNQTLGGATCIGRGFASGNLACKPDCTFNTSRCISAPAIRCGNNVIETGEECDGTSMGGNSCISEGFTGGTIRCTSCMIDTSGCTIITAADAQASITAAQAAIDTARAANRNVTEAEEAMSDATANMNAGQYAQAKSRAEVAKQLAESAPEGQGGNFLMIIVITGVIIAAGAAAAIYFLVLRPKGLAAEPAPPPQEE